MYHRQIFDLVCNQAVASVYIRFSLYNLVYFFFLKYDYNVGILLPSWRNRAIIIYHIHIKSSHQRCSVKKGVLRNFAKYTGKHLCQSLLFNKVAGLRPAPSLKKILCHRCFPVNLAKFLRTPFLPKTSGRLPLLVYFNKNVALRVVNCLIQNNREYESRKNCSRVHI